MTIKTYAFELKWFEIPEGVPNLSEHLFDLISETRRPAPRAWAIEGVLPLGEVALLTGHGGTGKSTLGLQMAAHMALGRNFLGKRTRRMPTIYVSLEDDVEEIRRRIWSIADAMGVTPTELKLVTGFGRGDFDPTLFGPNADGRLGPTPTYEFIIRAIEYLARRSEANTSDLHEDTRGLSAVVFIDNASVAFAGNENGRPEVRAFINELTNLARQYDLTIVLLGHVSKSGLATGEGYAGSTDWHNAVRLRLVLSKPTADRDGAPVDRAARELHLAKSNFGPDGQRWHLTLRDGYFFEEGPESTGGHVDAIETAIRETIAEHVKTGRRLSPSRNAANYAPKVAHRQRARRGERLRDFEAAFERLLGLGKIIVADDGAGSRRRQVVKLP